MRNEKGQGLVEYAFILVLAAIVVAMLVAWMFAGDCTKQDNPRTIVATAEAKANKAAVKACREVCYIAYGPGGNYESPSKLTKCYDICGD